MSAHQGLNQYFTTLVEHGQTQQERYATLGGHFNNFLGAAPGKVYSLSAPMAALGALSFETLDYLAPPAAPPVSGAPIVEEAFEGAAVAAGVGVGAALAEIIVYILIIIAIIVVIIVIVILIQEALDDHQKKQKGTNVRQPPQYTGPKTPNKGLTPEQQRIETEVEKLLQGRIYNDWEIEQLILAGFTNPTAIAAIIKHGSTFYKLFLDPGTAKLMNELPTAQQLKFIALVEQYQATHPNLASHQVYNALRFIKMKAQLDLLEKDVKGHTDIARDFPSDVQNFLGALDRVKQNMNGVTDPFAATDGKLNGWYGNLTGSWGEWSLIKHYYQHKQLAGFSVPITGGEVDIKIKEDGAIKWVEVKNVETKNQWRKAKRQIETYIQNGAKNVVVAFPQDGVNGTHNLDRQQLEDFKRVQRDHPDMKIELRTGENDPGIRMPFDPPSDNWGSYIP